MKKNLLLISFGLASLQCFSQANNFAYAKKMGGAFGDAGYAITTDANGNIFTTGYYQGTVDFDPNGGTANLPSNGGTEAFVQKLSPAGNLIWAKQIGGSGYEYGNAIAADAAGNIITGGVFETTVDFDPGNGVVNYTSAGFGDGFVQKLDAAGNFKWATRIGGTDADAVYAIANDSYGNIYAAGVFGGTVDFDPGAGTSSLTSNGDMDVFILKLDSSGSFIWVKQIGGAGTDGCKAIATDAAGAVFATGTFNATVDFDPSTNSFPLTSNGGSFNGDIYVMKLDSGGGFLWANAMGSFGDDIGYGMVTDAAGNVYTTGSFQSSVDFDPGTGVTTLITGGGGFNDDVFVQKLDAGGNFIWARNMGGTSDDRGYAITRDMWGNIYTTGFHSDGDFDPGNAVFTLTGSGTFISKLDASGNFVWAKHMNISQGNGINADVSGNIYTTGQFDHTVDFDPGTGNSSLTSNAGTLDVYIQKLSSSSAAVNEIFDNTSAIYPNPVKDKFTITLNKVYSSITLQIADITGKIIYNSNEGATNTIAVDLKAAPGFYMVTVTADGNSQSIKLIKNQE